MCIFPTWIRALAPEEARGEGGVGLLLALLPLALLAPLAGRLVRCAMAGPVQRPLAQSIRGGGRHAKAEGRRPQAVLQYCPSSIGGTGRFRCWRECAHRPRSRTPSPATARPRRGVSTLWLRTMRLEMTSPRLRSLDGTRQSFVEGGPENSERIVHVHTRRRVVRMRRWPGRGPARRTLISWLSSL